MTPLAQLAACAPAMPADPLQRCVYGGMCQLTENNVEVLTCLPCLVGAATRGPAGGPAARGSCATATGNVTLGGGAACVAACPTVLGAATTGCESCLWLLVTAFPCAVFLFFATGAAFAAPVAVDAGALTVLSFDACNFSCQH